VLEDFGHHELAIQFGRDGLLRARQLGLGRQMAAPIAGNLAESLTSAGRWDEALEILDQILSLGLPPLGRAHPLLVRGRVAVLRGDTEAASLALAELRSLPAGLHAESHYAFPLAELEIDARLASGELAGALAVASAPPARSGEGNPWFQWALLATAMRACADAAGAGVTRFPAPAPAPPPGLRWPGSPDGVAGTAEPAELDLAGLRGSLRRQAGKLARRNPRHHAYAALFTAEAARADGRLDLAAWDAASTAWEDLGEPYPAAYCHLHAARAALKAGAPDRAAAAGRLRRAAELAAQLSASPLLQRVTRLARQARVDLPAGQQAAPARFGLTGRELEVLRLVAAGRANRDIAAELFISPKTASVHVSNILAKLGVSSRVEAAATVHRLRLLDDQ
jgi:pentatricopeptide repeat protein